jgi:hypothetical protein
MTLHLKGVAVSLGLRAALEKHNIPGKIVLLGTPGASFIIRISSGVAQRYL